jgi:lipopolysaccharide transport system ATP-binding protein
MTEVAISAENLSKKYSIGVQKNDRNFREAIMGALKTPFGKIKQIFRGRPYGAAELNETFWALKGVSFEIKKGETVGIIGRNGAGKSTLLKILSRITIPTKGSAEINGRVSTLLEVGTGFHPELTGRENTYLSGAILGMRRAEIKKKFDEIVAFSEIDKFIDTPVKHYSSGMYVRLAFSVAAYLDTEILIVDEVLAVGDGRFQKKCIERMQKAAEVGNAVLFVSHNMDAISRLCKRAIFLQDGKKILDGPAREVVAAYLASGFGIAAAREWPDQQNAPGGDVARLRSVKVKEESGMVSDTVDIRRPTSIEMEYDILKEGYVLVPNFSFYNDAGLEIFASDDLDPSWRRRIRPKGRWTSVCTIPGNFLAEGTLFVRAGACTMEPLSNQFSVSEAVGFQVIDTMEGDSVRGDWLLQFGGVVRPLLQWKNIKKVDTDLKEQ